MEATSSATTVFGSAANSVVRKLATSTGIATWIFSRDKEEGRYTIAVNDPTGRLHRHQLLPLQYESSDELVQAIVHLPDGRAFGEIIGYGPAADDTPGLVEMLRLHAAMLGALAATELAAATDRRASEIATQERDPLTHVGTRQEWERRLRHDEELCREFGESAAVVVFELTELRANNQIHGYSAGDDQLRSASDLLRDIAPADSCAARVTGDRFALEVLGESNAEVQRLSCRLLEAILTTGTPMNIATECRCADASLGEAFSSAMDQLDLGGDSGHAEPCSAPTAHLPDPEPKGAEPGPIARAIVTDEIHPWYQPIINLHTGDVIALEALARYEVRGTVAAPHDFMTALRQEGLLNALFERMLDDGLATLRQERESAPSMQLAIHFQFDDSSDPDLLGALHRYLSKHDLPADSLLLEFGERTNSSLPPAVLEQLVAAAQLGVVLILDDPSTGFASLGAVQQLPIRAIKLGRRHIRELLGGGSQAHAAETLIDLARNLGLLVLAEGIETPAERQRLLELGCVIGQGHLFARPQPAREVLHLLATPTAG